MPLNIWRSLFLITFFLIGTGTLRVQSQQAQPNETLTPNVQLPTTRVSIEVKRMPIDILLQELSKQSGIELSAAKAYPAAKTLITARVRDMPLNAFLSALSRIYGVRWLKTDEKAFTMEASDLPPLEVKMLRARWSEFTNLGEAEAERQRNADLAGEIFDAVDDRAWRDKEGVPVAQLPQDLQLRIQKLVQASKAPWIVDEYATDSKVFGQDLYLRFAAIPKNATSFLSAVKPIISSISRGPRNGALLTVCTADGQIVMPVLTEFAVLVGNGAATTLPANDRAPSRPAPSRPAPAMH